MIFILNDMDRLKFKTTNANNGAAIETDVIAKKGLNLKTVLCLLLMTLTLSVYAQQTRPTLIVIGPLGDDVSMQNQIASGLTTAFVNSGKFRVLERAGIEEAIEEQNIKQAQLTSAQAIAIGKNLGAQYVVIGEYTVNNTSIRLVDAQSGIIEKANTIDNIGLGGPRMNSSRLNANEIVKSLMEGFIP